MERIKRLLLFTLKELRSIVPCILISTVLVFLFDLWLHGIPLLGTPSIENVMQVEITDANFSEKKVITDSEDIELAVKLLNFLTYKPGKAPEGKAPEGGTPENTELITIVYTMKDGSTVEVSADEETVLWKGKKRLLKNTEQFVTLTEGLFFPPVINEN